MIPATAELPQGAWLSFAAPHSRSEGHIKATGPISSAASSPWSCASTTTDETADKRAILPRSRPNMIALHNLRFTLRTVQPRLCTRDTVRLQCSACFIYQCVCGDVRSRRAPGSPNVTETSLNSSRSWYYPTTAESSSIARFQAAESHTSSNMSSSKKPQLLARVHPST